MNINLDSIPSVDLNALHEAIKAAIQTKYPTVNVDYYTRPEGALPLPSIFFELESIEPSNPSDSGDEQLEADFRFSAECVTTYKHGGKLSARVLAASLAAFIQRQRWGCPITPAKVTSAVPEHFRSDNPSYESWSVKWVHSGALGANLWAESGETPQEGFAGQEGQIILGDAPLYEEVFP